MPRWWWTGLHGAIEQRRQERAAAEAQAAAPAFRNVALVVGSTGIVGAALLDILPSPDTPAGPWKVYALSRRPLPPWSPAVSPAVLHLYADLADPAAVAEALAPLTDVTHVFYLAWSPRDTTVESREANCAMLRNVLTVVSRSCPALVHVGLQTGRTYFIDPFEAVDVVPRPYSEDIPPLDSPDLEYIFLDEIHGRDGAVSWSVHRPTTIFGFSPRSARNVVASLCVYAAICRKEGIRLLWPGSSVAWEGFSDACDAELVVEHALWAALEARGKNEAFNCTNGDVYKWQQLWPMLAGHFGVEWDGYVAEDKRFKLEEDMAGKEAVWAEIVRENGLVKTELDDITFVLAVNGSVHYTLSDYCSHQSNLSTSNLVS